MAKIVLLAEDSQELNLLERMLRVTEHEIFPTQTVRHALDVVRSQKPRLLITNLDLNEPGVNGIELIRRARVLNADQPNLRTLLLMEQEAYFDPEGQVDIALAKPLSPEALTATLDRLIDN